VFIPIVAFSFACGGEYDKFKERTKNELTPVEIHFLEQSERKQRELGNNKK
jgi:hypothetical protein